MRILFFLLIFVLKLTPVLASTSRGGEMGIGDADTTTATGMPVNIGYMRK